jgi:hypothetical protein
MSLTTFLDRKDVKEYLRLNVEKPWFQVGAQIGTPPLIPTAIAGWAGCAFDYLLRIYVQKLNPFAKARRWLAEESLAMLERGNVRPTALKRARSIVKTAREHHRSFQRSRAEEPGEKLIRAAVDLAQLDIVYRIKKLELRPVDDVLVVDVSNMLSLVRPADFKATRTCVLNATFGAASALVGGADGDLLIDDTLVDIKTSKDLELGRDIFNQVAGYYFLSCIGGIDGCRANVTSVAVYFARYGLLHRIPCASFVDETRLPELLKWFRATASDTHRDRA